MQNYRQFTSWLNEAKYVREEDDEVEVAKKGKNKVVVHDGDEDGSRVTEELKGKQHKLDKNKNGRLDAHDFELLRKEEEELDESWMSQRSSYDGPGKGKLLGDMSEKEHVDAINYHGTQIHQLKTGTHKYSKMYTKQQAADKLAQHMKHYTDHKDAYDAHTMKEEAELSEGTLMVSRHRNYARPGQGPEAHHITKDHGTASDGSRVYSVKQPNGFHGVLAVKGDTVVGSSQNNLSKDEAHKMGDHYVKHGTVGIGVGKHWSLGSGIHGKVVKEEVELDEANFASTMKKAIAAHERGDHERAKYHLDNAKTARYAMKSTEISKHKDLLDKYKELRDMHEETARKLTYSEFVASLQEAELDEAGAFSYGAKPPRKGSVAYNAMMKRKEQEKKQAPIEPKDQMIGVAKRVSEELELSEAKIIDRDSDLDQEHFKLSVNGKPVHFVHHNYEGSHATDSKQDIHYQVKNQLKHLSDADKKKVTDAVHASYRMKEEFELDEDTLTEMYGLDDQSHLQSGDKVTLHRKGFSKTQNKGEHTVDKVTTHHFTLKDKSGETVTDDEGKPLKFKRKNGAALDKKETSSSKIKGMSWSTGHYVKSLKEETELDEGQTVKTSTGYIHKGSYGSEYDTDEEGNEKKKAAPAVKRGRGRPKKGSDETGEVKKYTFHDLLNRLSR